MLVCITKSTFAKEVENTDVYERICDHAPIELLNRWRTELIFKTVSASKAVMAKLVADLFKAIQENQPASKRRKTINIQMNNASPKTIQCRETTVSA